MDSLETSHPPSFAKNRAGKATKVTLTPETYVKLLVEANVTNPLFWPPGLEEGAAKLARLRQIESDNQSKNGGFDWESLPGEIQGEYDALSVSLDSYQEPNDDTDWEDYKAQRKGNES
ncbi:MAG: hypothetical protein BZY80_02040 [SAR202 cluster bacterium Io17-Chloro-G2]|nr:MAG: hypothetical protein BZY80_02040 [SAR202 cluster bacterium Io17-Chloro-G2]